MKIITPKNIDTIDQLQIENQALKPFSDILVSFVDDVSKSILKDRYFKEYPELISLAFWMRKSHIKKLHKYFLQRQGEKLFLGRGVVFHLAPSNVDTIFVYSWFLSLLVGNSNIIRISNKKNIQTELLVNVITSILLDKRYEVLQKRVAIIRYGHEEQITKHLSLMADTRVIWGGDQTINNIRKIPIKSTATELTFADKFSFSIINSEKMLQEQDTQKLIEDFYNDAYWFGQMACSSIRLVVWIGSKQNNEKAKKIFWDMLESHLLQKGSEDIISADIINKFVAECSMAIEHSIKIEKNKSPYINRIEIRSLLEANESLHCGTGLFYEFETEDLVGIFKNITKKHQTIAYYGFSKEELTQIIYTTLPLGVDRVVPIGKSLEFSPVWDGYDLLHSFCREVEIWI